MESCATVLLCAFLLVALRVKVAPHMLRFTLRNVCLFPPFYYGKYGGDNRARTYDPLLVRQMLSQLSYAPMLW